MQLFLMYGNSRKIVIDSLIAITFQKGTEVESDDTLLSKSI